MTFSILKRQVAVRAENALLITTPLDGSPETIQDCVNCVHCGRSWVLGRALEEAIAGNLGFCMQCNGPTCPREECQECIPVDRMLDIASGTENLTTVRASGHFNGSLWLPGEN